MVVQRNQSDSQAELSGNPLAQEGNLLADRRAQGTHNAISCRQCTQNVSVRMARRGAGPSRRGAVLSCVLVVNGDHSSSTAIRALLELEGFEVVVADGSHSGLKAFESSV